MAFILSGFWFGPGWNPRELNIMKLATKCAIKCAGYEAERWENISAIVREPVIAVGPLRSARTITHHRSCD